MKILPLKRYEGVRLSVSDCEYILHYESNGKYRLIGWRIISPNEICDCGLFTENEISNNINHGWKVI